MENNIRCMDTDNNLEIWNYVECDNSSDDETKAHRGIIKDHEGNIIVPSFGYSDEYNEQQEEEITNRVKDFKDWTFHLSMEGTLLRLFHYGDEWYLTTHKKLNAFKSRWSCRETFGELFVSALKDIYNREDDTYEWLKGQLSKDYAYFFLVRSNQQNRIVCKASHLKKESVIYLGRYHDPSFVFYSKGNEEEVPVLNAFEASLVIGDEFEDSHGLCAYVEAIDPFQYQGVIGFRKGRLETVKIVHTEYQKYYRSRGNNPNLRFRYLEVRNDPEQLKLLYVLYPKYTILFDEYETTLYDIAKMIYHFYVNRYIKNHYVTLPREEYLLLKKCHQWYLQDRKNNRIFTQKVLELLSEEPPLHLYKMIRRFHLEHTEKRFRYSRNIEIPLSTKPKIHAFVAQQSNPKSE